MPYILHTAFRSYGRTGTVNKNTNLCMADSNRLWSYFLYAGKTHNRRLLEVFRRGLDFFFTPNCPSRRSGQLGGEKSLGSLEKPLDIADYVFYPHKKITSRTNRISGTIIVKISRIQDNVLSVFFPLANEDYVESCQCDRCLLRRINSNPSTRSLLVRKGESLLENFLIKVFRTKKKEIRGFIYRSFLCSITRIFVIMVQDTEDRKYQYSESTK